MTRPEVQRVCNETAGRCLRRLGVLSAAWLACTTASADPAAADPVPAPLPDAATSQPGRARIGLVLGGGGAKGAAHVGVIRVLEELRIPVDCVIGTSMGALVGGAYASGLDARELDKAVRSISWQEAIAFKGQREKMPIRRKLAGATYSNSLEFGLRDGRLTAPSGFINTQNIERTIQQLVSRSRGIGDFDSLPIPYRAIATDMQQGEMVVLSSGNLAQAMRASMSVPGVFSPVTVGGRVLGDGGLTRNLPVDVARQTCADVVIAVAVPNQVPTVEELQSPLTQVSRTIDVLVGANEKQQLDSLGAQDVGIVVQMGEIGSASFDKVAEAIPLGRAAALGQRAALERYTLPAREYRAWRESVSRLGRGSMRVAAVNVTGLERADEQYVREVFGIEPGDVVTETQIGKRVDAVFALADFETVRYAIHGDAAAPSLDLRVQEKSWGPDIFRFDLGLYMGTDGNTAFALVGDYLRPWINRRGGELIGSLRLGRTSGLDAALYQPLDRSHDWFVEPGVSSQRSVEDLYEDGEAVARYTLSEAWGYLDAGRAFGSRAELRAGLRAGTQWAERNIAFPAFPEIPGEGYGGWGLRFTYDTRDRELLGRNGLLARVSYFRSEESLGAVSSYERAEGTATFSMPVGDNLLYARGSGGSSFDTDLPVYDLFTLGGPVSFPGLNIGELRGASYWSAQVGYLHQVAEISNLFGQALYAGFSLTAGDMGERLELAREDTIYSGAFILSGRTPLGPVGLSIAISNTANWQVVFGQGRPIE
jgi:NTE family protein